MSRERVLFFYMVTHHHPSQLISQKPNLRKKRTRKKRKKKKTIREKQYLNQCSKRATREMAIIVKVTMKPMPTINK